MKLTIKQLKQLIKEQVKESASKALCLEEDAMKMRTCWCGAHDDFVAGCPAHDKSGMSADPIELRKEIISLRKEVSRLKTELNKLAS